MDKKMKKVVRQVLNQEAGLPDEHVLEWAEGSFYGHLENHLFSDY